MSEQPKVIEKREPDPILIGRFRCSGAGNKKESPCCGSLLQITWETIFIQHVFRKSKLSFICPICNNITDINYKKYRVQQPNGFIVPTKSEYLKNLN